MSIRETISVLLLTVVGLQGIGGCKSKDSAEQGKLELDLGNKVTMKLA